MTHMTRRSFLRSSAFAVVALRMPMRQTPPASAGPPDPMLIEDLVAAYRILAQQGVVDGYGHVSARHNRNPNRFIMARSLAPELVTAADLLEFDLDRNRVDAKGRPMDSEGLTRAEIVTERNVWD